MSTVQTQLDVSIEGLLKGVEQLSSPELDEFVFRVTALQTKRKSSSLSDEEKELLLNIYQGLPPHISDRYAKLIAKRESETLLPDEHQALLDLTDQVERLETKCVKYLAKLAHLRQTSVEALAKDLQVSFYTDALTTYLDTHRPGGVTAILNRIYETESSRLDPVVAQLQTQSIGGEDW